jgi:uncharacterized protein YggU (UPF0235/DUF167 family)
VAVLAEAIGVSKSAIELVSGATSAKKQFLVAGASEEEIRDSIGRAVG